ncbi:inositol monophosphatase family protein [Pseudooceanicola nanhaiensis]|uniref:inositol monophosphatase family protein n=1 Tax=Pseudooceanicola nanhaiensis TaxID=375761 RepID=UPI001CD217A4|nr:inositol monophosphatase family protein [Pseudooceanicola nanhaiensis]MCA0922202.1 inositol monophosphatase [Pseudooceanicola nanhaiensis]
MPGSANLNIMLKAARKAGRSLVKDFREVENLQVSMKGAGDFVSRADVAAQEILKGELMGARPTYGWVAEEGKETIEGQDPTRRWIVDPLDGTTNFLHGLPHWAISIALEHKGQIVAGVIYDAAKDEMFFAEKGEGAWMNESRLRVSGRGRMIESIFATGLPFATSPHLPRSLQDLARVLPACAGVRRFGSAALDMAYVAAGRYEGYWERGLNSWDIAAGIVIVREAGGFVEGINPEHDPLAGDLVCGNEAIFNNFAKVIRNS